MNTRERGDGRRGVASISKFAVLEMLGRKWRQIHERKHVGTWEEGGLHYWMERVELFKRHGEIVIKVWTVQSGLLSGNLKKESLLSSENMEKCVSEQQEVPNLQNLRTRGCKRGQRWRRRGNERG